ncbi:MAG: hypothetical protein ABSF08_12115 [Candidatus Cybelea sp.]
MAGERIDESALRHPHERLIFGGLVVLNFPLMGAAIGLIVHDRRRFTSLLKNGYGLSLAFEVCSSALSAGASWTK